MTSQAEKIRLKIIQLRCAVGVKTSCSHVRLVCGWFPLGKSFPVAVALSSLIPRGDHPHSSPTEAAGPQSVSSAASHKVLETPLLPSVGTDPGPSRGEQSGECSVSWGKNTAPLLSVCYRHCCQGKLPQPRTPSLGNASHGNAVPCRRCSSAAAGQGCLLGVAVTVAFQTRAGCI